MVEELKRVFTHMKRDWSEVNNRINRHVVWAHPILGFVDSYGYTLGIRVFKLDQSKLIPKFEGNVVDFGTY